MDFDRGARLDTSQVSDRRGAGGRDRLRERLQGSDIRDGLDAASSVGDDRIQEKARGRVDPESWTHGSAAQRQRWFLRGYEGRSARSCDTFTGNV